MLDFLNKIRQSTFNVRWPLLVLKSGVFLPLGRLQFKMVWFLSQVSHCLGLLRLWFDNVLSVGLTGDNVVH